MNSRIANAVEDVLCSIVHSDEPVIERGVERLNDVLVDELDLSVDTIDGLRSIVEENAIGDDLDRTVDRIVRTVQKQSQ